MLKLWVLNGRQVPSEGTGQAALEGEESWREVVKEKNAGKELVGKDERG